MLTVNQLSCHYPQFPLNFTLSVSAGERIVLLGPSGAGKSTLLNLLAGFIPATHGNIWIAGENITDYPPAKRPLSMLFQENNLFTHLSVRQNLALGLTPSMHLSSQQTDSMLALAQRTGLLSLLDRLPHQLSGGQRQRVALTRCLLRNRPLLLLDEPFSALDPALRQEMLMLTDELCRENQLTLLMVSHQLTDAQEIADRCMVIDQGKVAWEGNWQQLAGGDNHAATLLGIAPISGQ
ncbi:thiamine ABC transporter ATP-binding protein ThiQ [Rosenbergiella australiborealis]|uniref:Thiamine ABC transporter ATP-binding protein ThiQ n=1 Tax=Rosenbergiella australiborealis TaxID=1544696 RepID=A0ABS5T1G2_9GAMM|nr:thiamine ABC transporter ATP-binding protein ThiQ [Rosenbergiella australiborealis]MBT0726160.1 thiamine ABC transporter ATP-binding protein ThiQ [Rosenbergiella australiborealis]